MALIQSTAIPSGATDYELEQSLKFEQSRSAYLSKTFVTPTNRKIWTFSFWFKRGNLSGSSERRIFSTATGAGGNTDNINYTTGDAIRFIADFGQLICTQVFRDPSAWYHLMYVYDSTQSTEANRLKLYVNGTQVTSFSTTAYPSLNQEIDFNSAVVHDIGRNLPETTQYYDGYLAELYWVDGQAKAPADFGETGDYGEWKPIEYEGTYGTNGFYLPFKQDYTVEGFSTVTYRGSGATQYIGGTGFKPDLVWAKERSNTSPHRLADSIRGTGVYLESDNTSADKASTTSITSFNSDGFTVGTNTHHNASGDTYVAWNWDMDSSTRTKLNISAEGTAKQVTAQSKVPASSSSIYTPSGSANYVQLGSDGDIDFGSDNFTIEFWVKDGSGYFLSGYGGTHSIYIQQTGSSAGSIYINTSGGDGTISISPTWSNWVHIAIVRNSNTFTAYINGTSAGTLTLSGTVSSSAYRLGRNGTDTADGSGYFDELRISNTARYTGNFTAPTTAFSEDANTLMLIHSLAPDNQTYILDGGSISTAGSINSSVMANPTYGQSIVSYTGTGSATTVGHGLSSAPEMVVVKSRDAAENWVVFHTSINSGQGYIKLNSTDAATTGSSRRFRFGNDSDGVVPDSTKVYIGSGGEVNTSGNDYIAYCFHSVTGYSSLGSWVGNANDTAPVITTGFAPAFVMYKKATGAADWVIVDNTRNPSGIKNKVLYPNSDPVEYSSPDAGQALIFNSTGFQPGGAGGDMNGNGETYIYMAFADKREYAYWLDQSGNNNDWTSNHLTESDISVDSPTNNFCTWNPLDKSSSQTLSEGNLVSDSTVNDAWKGVRGTFGISSGKWYWEYLKTNTYLHSTVGIAIADAELDVSTALSGITDWWMYSSYNGAKIGNGSETSYGATYQDVGDVVGIALDMDNGTLTFYKNGVSQGQAFNSGLSGKTVYPYRLAYNSADLTVANFGQDSSFAANKTAQGKQDGNDIGDFYYTPPTGFLALCTKNLPDVAVVPSEHFNTVLYSGNGSTQSITGVGHQPDFTWIKKRGGGTARNHILTDAVRGATVCLSTSLADGDFTNTSGLTAFGTDGFSLGSYNSVNESGGTYVAWNWKANGSGSSNTNGSINTTATSANVDAGFSIITYSGNATSGATIGHGLSKAPEFFTVKRRSSGGDDWNTYYGDNTDFLRLNGTAATSDNAAMWNDTSPSNSLITLGNHAEVNSSGETYVCYAFHSVDGYSKVGSYIANGEQDDGTFIYTGFRPAFVMIKKTSASASWYMTDSERYDTNRPYGSAAYLFADSSAAESTTENIDMLSNGFKARRDSGYFNYPSGATYIYIAFAETPFKYSNAR